MYVSLAQYFGDRSGNFATTTALLALPLLGTIGMAVDVGYAIEQRAALLAAADAAAIGALSTQSVGVLAAINSSANGTIVVAEKDARKLFEGQLPSGMVTKVTDLAIDITKEDDTMNSVVTFKAQVPTSFLKLLSHDMIEVSGTATATYNTGTFMDFYMLLDNTPSMGVGATMADIETMERHTSDKCAFACHDESKSYDYYDLAKDLGVAMRIDVVREAVQQLTYSAAKAARYPSQYRMGIYTFGTSAKDTKLTEISTLSSDMNAVRTAANAIDLMSIPYQNYNHDQATDLDNAFKNLEKIIKKGGSGKNKTDPEKVVFFVSDGLTDSAKGSSCTKKTTGTRCQEPIDYSVCEPLKKKGIKIAALYTTYLPLPQNAWYNSWIKPFQSEIADRMRSCASPGLYFEVSPTEGIAEAMEALFQKVIGTPRLAS